MSKTYVFKVLLFLDMFVCALIWRDSGITISSMTGLAMRRPNPPWWAQALYWALDHLEKQHCEQAIANDILRARAALLILTGEVGW